ncbi:5072_t:CDS:2, partial [Racocetra fulgida]
VDSETNAKEQQIENQIEEIMDDEEDDFREFYSRDDDLREDDLREDDLMYADLRKDDLIENDLGEDNNYAEAPDNENDFERHNFPQETFTMLYNSSDEFEAAKWVVNHPEVLKLAI